MGELAALAHHAYLTWDAGVPTWRIDIDQARTALKPGAAHADASPSAGYLQVPERLVWASLAPDAPAEPLDGCFVHSVSPGGLRVLGIFGMHPGRMGFSVVEAVGAPAPALVRPDGSAPFSPVLAGGAAAGIHSLVGRSLSCRRPTARAQPEPVTAAAARGRLMERMDKKVASAGADRRVHGAEGREFVPRPTFRTVSRVAAGSRACSRRRLRTAPAATKGLALPA
jgi:hypothetical protein